MKRFLSSEGSGGYIMIIVIMSMVTFMIITAAIAASGTSNFSAARRSLAGLNALATAEAGADNLVFTLNQNSSYTGTNTSCPITSAGSHPVTLYSDSVKGKATYETCVTNGSIANEKIVYATGKVYLPQNASSPLAVRRIKLVIEGSSSGAYAVQTGPGGLIMSNSATISNGGVAVGGGVTMSNTAQIGSPSIPVGVAVADYLCPSPPNSSYPVLCPANSNPISISNQAHIYGAVQANNQTSTAGMSNPGLTSSSGVAAVTLPDYDRASQISAVTSTMSAASASCSGNQNITWPANVHITGGDVSLNNGCTVTAAGNVWIDGGLSLSQQSVLKTASSVTQTANVMVDGATGVSLGNQTSIATNATNIGFQVITFWSTAACSPNCSNVTGTDLYNSQTKQTIDVNNQGLSAGSTFYARWTELTLGQSGSIGSILGQTIKLNNTGNISFTSSTGSPTFTWDVRYYQEI